MKKGLKDKLIMNNVLSNYIFKYFYNIKKDLKTTLKNILCEEILFMKNMSNSIHAYFFEKEELIIKFFFYLQVLFTFIFYIST